MKPILLIFIALLTACGGASNSEDPQWVKDYDACLEGEGNREAHIIEKENITTGEVTVEVECLVWDVL